MAWPTRSKSLALSRTVTPAAATSYNAGGPAAGHTWLVKQITLTNGTGATRQFYVEIDRSGVKYQCFNQSVASGQSFLQVCNIVLEAGDQLTYGITSTGAGNIQLLAFGALLG